MIKGKYFSFIVVSCLALSSDISYAGQIDVVNKNNKELKVKIRAEGDTAATFIQTIPAKLHSSFSVDRNHLNGKPYYAIQDNTSAFTRGGKCEHLNIDKNYTVTFQNDTLGTTCIAEEQSLGSSKS